MPGCEVDVTTARISTKRKPMMTILTRKDSMEWPKTKNRTKNSGMGRPPQPQPRLCRYHMVVCSCLIFWLAPSLRSAPFCLASLRVCFRRCLYMPLLYFALCIFTNPTYRCYIYQIIPQFCLLRSAMIDITYCKLAVKRWGIVRQDGEIVALDVTSWYISTFYQ